MTNTNTEQLIMELLQKMHKTILETNKDLKEIKQEIIEMKQDIIEAKQEIVEMKQEISETKKTIGSLGGMFEHKVNIQEKEDSIMKTLKYLSHKVSEHDEDIFHLKNKK